MANITINLNIGGKTKTRSIADPPPPIPDIILKRGFADAHPFRDRKLKPKKKKQCTKGHQCGFSCVSPTKTCLADMTTAQLKAHNAAKRAERKAKKAAAAGGGGAIQHKPFMSEAEASEYTKNSVWANRTFFHGTSQIGADAITGEGIDVSKNTSAFYGQGFYMGGTSAQNDGLSIASGYASERPDSQVLEMKVRTRKPLEVTEDEFHGLIREQIKEGNIPKLRVDMESGSVNAEYMQGVTSYLKSQGYDALYIKNLDYAIAFDPKQVAVYSRFDANNPPKASQDKVKAEQTALINGENK